MDWWVGPSLRDRDWILDVDLRYLKRLVAEPYRRLLGAEVHLGDRSGLTGGNDDAILGVNGFEQRDPHSQTYQRWDEDSAS